MSSRDWPADQNHPLQALGTHRFGLVVMSFGNLKTGGVKPGHNPHLVADSKEPREGAEAHSKSSKQWGERDSPLRNQVQVWGGIGLGYTVPGSVFS